MRVNLNQHSDVWWNMKTSKYAANCIWELVGQCNRNQINTDTDTDTDTRLLNNKHHFHKCLILCLVMWIVLLLKEKKRNQISWFDSAFCILCEILMFLLQQQREQNWFLERWVVLTCCCYDIWVGYLHFKTHIQMHPNEITDGSFCEIWKLKCTNISTHRQTFHLKIILWCQVFHSERIFLYNFMFSMVDFYCCYTQT